VKLARLQDEGATLKA